MTELVSRDPLHQPQYCWVSCMAGGAGWSKASWVSLQPDMLQAVPAAPPTTLCWPPPQPSSVISSLSPSTPGPPTPELLRSADLGLHAAGLVLLGRHLIPLLLLRKKDSEKRGS